MDISAHFELSASVIERFLEGLDDIGITMRSTDSIDSYESNRPPWKPVTK